MKKSIILSLSLTLSSFYGIGQTFIASHSFGSTAIDTGVNTEMLEDGGVLVGGLYSTTLEFGDSAVTWAGGNADGYLAKYNSDGDPEWIKSLGGPADDIVNAFAEAPNGDILVMGYFQGAGPLAFDADPGPDEYLLEQTSPLLSRDCYIVRLDSEGNFIWAKQISNPGGAAQEDGYAIKVDANNNVYVAGRYQYADFNTSDTEEDIRFSYNDGQYFNPFLVKLDGDGNLVWVQTPVSTGHAAINALDFDDEGNIYAGGYFEGDIDLNPSEDEEDSFTSNGGRDIFTMSFTPDGEYISGFGIGGVGLDILNDLMVVDENIYICGAINLSVDMDPTDEDYTLSTVEGVDGVVAKYSLDGEIDYAFTVGGASGTSVEEFHSLSIDNEGNPSASGNFYDTVDVDPGVGVISISAEALADHFVLTFTPEGLYMNHAHLAGTDMQSTSSHEVNDNNEYFFMGTYRGSVDLDPSSGASISTANGQYDMGCSWFYFEGTPDGVNNISFTEGLISLYPNPAPNSFTIDAPFIMEELSIFDLMGKKVMNLNNPTSMNIDISTLPNGLYIVQIKDDNNQLYTGKVMH